MSTSTRRSLIFRNAPGGDRRRLERKAARGDEGAIRRLLEARLVAGGAAEDERVRMAASLGHPVARVLRPSEPERHPIGEQKFAHGSWSGLARDAFVIADEFVGVFGSRFPVETVLLALDMEQKTLRRVRWDVHDPQVTDLESVESRRCGEAHSAKECPKARMTPREIAVWDVYYDELKRLVRRGGVTLPPPSPARTTWQHWDCEHAESVAVALIHGAAFPVRDCKEALVLFLYFWEDDDRSASETAARDVRAESRSEWVRRRLADLILEPLLEGPR